MLEVVPGIYQLILPNPPQATPRYVNAYLARGSNKYLLIDTGWGEKALVSLQKQLTKIGICFGDINQVVITHAHPDHYGLASRLKQLSGAKLALHHLGKNIVGSRFNNEREFISQLDQWWLVNGVPINRLAEFRKGFLKNKTDPVVPILPDITLRGNETISNGIFNFRVLWTPGHSARHISLYEPEQKILFSGDHILPNIYTNIGIALLPPEYSSNPLDDYLRSLNEIKQLEVDLILPGHGNHFTDLGKRVEKIIRHHKRRTAETAKIIAIEAKTTYQVATELTWRPATKGARWQDLDLWGQRLSVAETAAHLESLRFNGKADRFFRDGVTYYHLVEKVK